MRKIKTTLLLLLSLPLFFMLFWIFAVPGDVVRERIEKEINQTQGADLSVAFNGFRKGPFFNLAIDSLELYIADMPLLTINDVSARPSLSNILMGQLALSLTGKLGSGNILGVLAYPEGSMLRIVEADIGSVTYLKKLGIQGSGHLSAEADLDLKTDSVKVTFQIPDLNIHKSEVVIPLIETFHRIQGSFSITGNRIELDSVSLEGEKGYARLIGEITNGIARLKLEVMPEADKLSSLETMLITKYFVSPGYYVVPLEGSLRQ